MSTCRFFVLIALAAMLAFIVGCSGGSSPIEPPNEMAGAAGDLPMLVETQAGDLYGGTGIIGAYELNIDPENPENNYLIPKRTLAIGEDYLVSGLGFFDYNPCPNCIRWVLSIWQVIEYKCYFNGDFWWWELVPYCCITIDPHIWHPFDAGNPAEPPSATNRNDLDVFDLAVIVVPDEADPILWPGFNVSSYCTICQNVDFYTTELADMLGDDTACPAFLVVDDSLTEPDCVITNNRFKMGTNDFEFLMSFYDGGKMTLYLTMGYGASAKKMGRLTPRYFLPEFNRKAAWKVNAYGPWPDSGICDFIPGDTWMDNNNVDLFPVTVEVYDWQQGAPVYSGAPADYGELGGLDEVFAASEVSAVEVEMPGMYDGIKSATFVSGTGQPCDPLIYEALVANTNLLGPGRYTGMVKVTDSRTPGTIGDRGYLIDSPDGIALINYTIPEYVVYQKFIFFVGVGCGPIDGGITIPADCPVTGLTTGSTVDFEVYANSANGGDPIVLYEIDYCYDGTTFNVSDSNATGIFTAGPYVPPDPCEDNIPYTCTVAFRATDSCYPPNVTLFATCDVTVEICCTDQELFYDWAGCNGDSCAGWIAGGCGLPNISDLGYGAFSWRCPHGTICSGGLVAPYITSDWNPDYGFCSNFHYYNPNMNVVSPVINLPPSDDGVIEWDWCMYRCPDCTFRLHISEAGCSGPWTQLWTSTTNGCHVGDTSVDISGYSGNNIMFRYQYNGAQYQFSYGNCNAGGVTIDNVSINGCFAGTLSD